MKENDLTGSTGDLLKMSVRAFRVMYLTAMMAMASFASALAVAGEAVPTPEGLVAEIERDGARAVVVRLWSDDELFEAILARIESGDAAWLDVARRLRPGSDAGASESLNYAVALALPRAPSRVLPMIGDPFPLGFICTAPHMDASSSVVLGHLRAVERALALFKTAKYAAVKSECLAAIRGQIKKHSAVKVVTEPQQL